MGKKRVATPKHAIKTRSKGTPDLKSKTKASPGKTQSKITNSRISKQNTLVEFSKISERLSASTKRINQKAETMSVESNKNSSKDKNKIKPSKKLEQIVKKKDDDIEIVIENQPKILRSGKKVNPVKSTQISNLTKQPKKKIRASNKLLEKFNNVDSNSDDSNNNSVASFSSGSRNLSNANYNEITKYDTMMPKHKRGRKPKLISNIKVDKHTPTKKKNNLSETKSDTKKEFSNINPPIRSILKKSEIKAEDNESAIGSVDSRSKSIPISATESILRKAAKQQYAGKVDTQSISEEISRIIKRVEEKKKKSKEVDASTTEIVGSKKASKKKEKVRVSDKKFKAEDHFLNLQRDSNSHHKFIDFFEIHAKGNPVICNSDLLLAIIEIASNSLYYKIPLSSKSKNFWEEVIKYNELKGVFGYYKADTLKKYWGLLSKKDNPEKAADLIKKKKKLLDQASIK